MNLETKIIFIFGFFSVTWGIGSLIFTHTSMKYIERKLLEAGIQVPWWDQRGWGFRISLLISLISRGKPSKNSVLADKEILKCVRPYDRAIAIIVNYSFIFAIFFAALNYFLYEI